MDILEQSYTFGRSPLGEDLATAPRDVYIFGGHIAQSLSPRLHNLMFAARRVPWHFLLCQTTDADRFTAKLQDDRCLGNSITMPNKVTFIPRLDELTDEARAIGAVNTSFVRLDGRGRRKWIGANTDCVGIREAVLARFPDAPTTTQSRPAMVLGAGGAARSAVYALWRWFGASEIYVVNRLKSEVDALITSFERSVPGIRLRYVSSLDEMARLETPRIIVGTVPDMPPQDEDEVRCRALCDAVLSRPDQGMLVDMCYMPSPQTTLYTTAVDKGWRVVSGTEVVARVCIAQNILWLEKDVNEATVRQVLEVVEETVGGKMGQHMPDEPAAKL
ncbi:hypothetical protein SEUCBS139899_002823 [Sporothrix eucalyptigena]|uniref:Shikimate dehydrogenase substrate binding N-terminal domain-containing protein n=1 Tax=Sporothrix eucalyptigena TaxID=1812306 RepID=A0ABP0CFV2_9PEZI